MRDEIKSTAKEALKLFYLCEQLEEMKDPNTTKYYDTIDFMQIEIEIRELKESVISKITKL
jgi:hypothetical protein